jgi:putative acetyltransferase
MKIYEVSERTTKLLTNIIKVWEQSVRATHLFLFPKERGKGIGRLLLEKTIETAQELGYLQIYLESIPEFSTAVSIYEKQGFQYLNQPLGNTGHDGCNLWMLKEM